MHNHSQSLDGWRGRRVLVTGAGGFIGSHLTEALVRAGARVRALHRYNSAGSWGHLELLPSEIRQELEVVLGDVRDPASVASAVEGCGWVFHLAALIGIPYSYAAPESYVQTNVLGTLYVLQACRAQGVERLVHTSTSEVYGTARHVPMDEGHPLQAQSPYAATKIAADKLAESFHLSFGLHGIDGDARINGGGRVQHLDPAGFRVHFDVRERDREGRRAIGIEMRSPVHDLHLFLVQSLQSDVADARAARRIVCHPDFVIAAGQLVSRCLQHLPRDGEHL